MREIEFRGKHTQNKEWAHGFFFLDDYNNPKIISGDSTCHIIPETVGQYIGIKGKDGVKIFEGDLVSFVSEEFGLKKMFGAVQFANYAWSIITGLFVCSVGAAKNFEVKGNIFDNPELLGSGNIEEEKNEHRKEN